MSDTKIHIFDRETNTLNYSAGDTIIEQGQAADRMYVVQSGEVEIHLLAGVTETVEAGGFFGEMSLISSEPRSATVTAKTDVKLVPVDQNRFKFMVQETPNFALTVMRVLVERLRRRNAYVAELLANQNNPL